MTIVVDTREKDPYTFGNAVTIRHKLNAGDYSIVGLEDRIAIERKNLDDFVSTIIYHKNRFHNELCELARMDFAAVVVEASLTDIFEHRYKSAVHPMSVIGAAVALMVGYRVPILFCDSRQLACHVTQSILQRYSSKFQGKQ